MVPAQHARTVSRHPETTSRALTISILLMWIIAIFLMYFFPETGLLASKSPYQDCRRNRAVSDNQINKDLKNDIGIL